MTRLQSGRIECASPARTSDGLVDVHVSLNGIDTDFGASGYSFKYYDQPAPHPGSGFAQIVPNGGPVGGGTYVTIDGVGFLAFAPEISFVRCRWDGGVVDPVAMRRAKLPLDLPPPESSAATHTDERVVCLAPRARPGAGLTVNVSLSLNARDFGSTGLTFQYYQPPRIDIITPSGGHRTGGTIVTIHGAGFNVLDDGAHVSCEFGRGEVYNAKFTVVRPVERVTHSTIVCEAPTTKVSDTRGLWIALNGYEIDGGRDPMPTNQNYTYYNPPTVDSVLPQAGVFSGGTVVTLLGQGFYGLAGNPELASCRFVVTSLDGEPVVQDTSPIALLSNFWTCRSPSQSNIQEGEAASVLITLNMQQYVDTGYKFSYYGLRVDEVSVNDGPPGGVASGGTIVTLRGLGFDVGPVAYCRFGESKAQISSVISVDAEKLVCATPPAPRKVLHGDGTAEDVHLLLSTDNVVYIDIGYDYTYYDQPTAFSQVVPEGGPKRGGTAVTLTGGGFTRFNPAWDPLTNADKRSAARCLWGGDFASRLRISGNIKNVDGSSPPADATAELLMSGEAGVTAPSIVRATLADPDNGDAVFSDGDVLTIVFDMSTNQAGEGALTYAGGRELVDGLFSFSDSLGSRYTGRWLDASVFGIEVIDATGHGDPSPGSTTVSVIGDIKNANELSRWCKAVATLSGDVGRAVAPQIGRFEAATWDRKDAGWSRYDTLRVSFDQLTDLGGREGGKDFVDTVLAFSHPLGADYSGAWSDRSTFLVTILDPTGASPGGPPINETSGAVISVAGQLRNRPGTSSLAYGEHTLSVGNWGEVRAPRLLRFFARDADNLNASCDTGDELIVQFDMAVNRGECMEWSLSTDNLPVCARRPSGGAAFVDSLFGVTALLGTNYSGAWTDGSTFAITITDAPRELAPAPFNTLLKVPAGANVRNANATSDALVFGPELMGAAERFETFPEPPVLTSIVANDFANVDLRVGPGDTITIAFDRPTDRGVDSAGTPRNGECTWAWNNAGTQRVRTQDLSNCELHRLFDLLRENDKGQHVKITEVR